MLRCSGLDREDAWFSASQLRRHLPTDELLLAGVRRRSNREPLAHILESTDFFGLKNVIVRPPLLVPRPETEQLVQLIVDTYGESPPKRFVDACAGTGVMAVALLTAWPNAVALAIDISEIAASCVSENARRFGVDDRIHILHKSISESKDEIADFRPNLVVSNPPYIPSERIPTLQPEIVNFEDSRALDGGPDGLTVISEVLSAAADVQDIWLEVDSESQQSRTICNRVNSGASIFIDWFGKERFVRIRNNR